MQWLSDAVANSFMHLLFVFIFLMNYFTCSQAASDNHRVTAQKNFIDFLLVPMYREVVQLTKPKPHPEPTC